MRGLYRKEVERLDESYLLFCLFHSFLLVVRFFQLNWMWQMPVYRGF